MAIFFLNLDVYKRQDQLQLLSLDLETEEPKTIDLNLNIYPNQLIVKNNKLYLISDSGDVYKRQHLLFPLIWQHFFQHI